MDGQTIPSMLWDGLTAPTLSVVAGYARKAPASR
jgi:hypothetical protein